MPQPIRKYATIFHNEGDTQVWIVTSGSDQVVRRDGISDKNIGELVKAISTKGYHVTLYKVAKPVFFAENSDEEAIKKNLGQ